MTISGAEQRLQALERRTIKLGLICGIQLVIVCVLCLTLVHTRRVETAGSIGILRAKGLIIEDGDGRARILLGAPFPKVPERSRQDAPTTSMIFLDQEGHDRLR